MNKPEPTANLSETLTELDPNAPATWDWRDEDHKAVTPVKN